MGMLTSFLAGASRGLDVLGQGMLKDVEREKEQDIWEKRTALLQQIQRESAKNIREDENEFQNRPDVVDAKIGTATKMAEASGKTSRRLKTDELTDPELNAAKQTEEDRKAAKDRDNYKAETPLMVDRSGKMAGAAASAQQRVRDSAEAKARVNPLEQKFNDFEQATKTKLPEEVKLQLGKAYLGLGKEDDGLGKQAIAAVLKSYSEGTIKADQVGAEFGSVMRSMRPDSQVMKPPQGAIDMLVKDPSLASAFEAKYGSGSSAVHLAGKAQKQATPAAPAQAPPLQKIVQASDGSGRGVDASSGRTMTPEQMAVYEKIQRGEPTTPRERALLNGL